jgi:hypothetical protein
LKNAKSNGNSASMNFNFKSLVVLVFGLIFAIVAAHFIIKWLEGSPNEITGNPRKKIGPEENLSKTTIDIEADVNPAGC